MDRYLSFNRISREGKEESNPTTDYWAWERQWALLKRGVFLHAGMAWHGWRRRLVFDTIHELQYYRPAGLWQDVHLRGRTPAVWYEADCELAVVVETLGFLKSPVSLT